MPDRQGLGSRPRLGRREALAPSAHRSTAMRRCGPHRGRRRGCSSRRLSASSSRVRALRSGISSFPKRSASPTRSRASEGSPRARPRRDRSASRAKAIDHRVARVVCAAAASVGGRWRSRALEIPRGDLDLDQSSEQRRAEQPLAPDRVQPPHQPGRSQRVLAPARSSSAVGMDGLGKPSRPSRSARASSSRPCSEPDLGEFDGGVDASRAVVPPLADRAMEPRSSSSASW